MNIREFIEKQELQLDEATSVSTLLVAGDALADALPKIDTIREKLRGTTYGKVWLPKWEIIYAKYKKVVDEWDEYSSKARKMSDYADANEKKRIISMLQKIKKDMKPLRDETAKLKIHYNRKWGKATEKAIGRTAKLSKKLEKETARSGKKYKETMKKQIGRGTVEKEKEEKKYIKAKGKKVGETAEKFRKKIFRGKIASKIKDTGRLLSGKLKRAFEDEDWNSKVLSYLGR